MLKGEKKTPEFLNVNPIGYVPALVDGDLVMVDSFAIIMYLEEKYPQHPLLPRDHAKKAIIYQNGRIDYNEFVAMVHNGSATLTKKQLKDDFSAGLREPVPVSCFLFVFIVSYKWHTVKSGCTEFTFIHGAHTYTLIHEFYRIFHNISHY
ncbi:glutathione S-transferase-like [Helianthus annuus]|uniref:glutathione S-transferase-like n=1 Tax=Helianthus annuus TaxID=4232 RepID=UPI000B906CB3|nr:glutathione S-transferase-like [Helianthus annuus]